MDYWKKCSLLLTKYLKIICWLQTQFQLRWHIIALIWSEFSLLNVKNKKIKKKMTKIRPDRVRPPRPTGLGGPGLAEKSAPGPGPGPGLQTWVCVEPGLPWDRQKRMPEPDSGQKKWLIQTRPQSQKSKRVGPVLSNQIVCESHQRDF